MKALETGAMGERLACEIYQKNGYKCLEKNYRTRLGEIDLILEKDCVLVFCEVKTRGSGSIAAPREWVNAKKQRKIVAAALNYLQTRGLGEPVTRFDVAEVYLGGAAPTVEIIENAFTV